MYVLIIINLLNFWLIKKKISFFFFNQKQKSESSGKVAIQLISYSNIQDFDYNGNCCNGDMLILNNSSNPLCSQECNTLINICLDNYQSTSGFSNCPYGQRSLSAINDQSSIYFTVPTAGDVENPILIPFSHNYQVFIY